MSAVKHESTLLDWISIFVCSICWEWIWDWNMCLLRVGIQNTCIFIWIKYLQETVWLTSLDWPGPQLFFVTSSFSSNYSISNNCTLNRTRRQHFFVSLWLTKIHCYSSLMGCKLLLYSFSERICCETLLFLLMTVLFCSTAKGLDHIAENILSFLDASSLCAAERVCKEWYRVISDGMLWKKLIERKVRTDPLWRGLSERRGWYGPVMMFKLK